MSPCTPPTGPVDRSLQITGFNANLDWLQVKFPRWKKPLDWDEAVLVPTIGHRAIQTWLRYLVFGGGRHHRSFAWAHPLMLVVHSACLPE
jgi:hypothetical protein